MVSISTYSSSERIEVINLLRFHWKKESFKDAERFFHWRYEKNPYYPTPLIVIAKEQSDIIGVRPFVVQRFKLKNLHPLVASGADAYIRPDSRGLGIFHAMNEYSKHLMHQANIQLSLNISSNKITFKANKKAGWCSLGRRKIWYKLKFWGQGNEKTLKKGIASQMDTDLEIVFNNHIPHYEISLLWEEFFNDKLQNRRDQDYYKWRFSDSEKYAFTGIYSKDKLLAYLILKNIGKGQVLIVEHFASSGSLLKFMVLHAMKKSNSNFARILDYCFDEKETEVIRNAGFFEEPYLFPSFLGLSRNGVLIRNNFQDPDYSNIERSGIRIFHSDVH